MNKLNPPETSVLDSVLDSSASLFSQVGAALDNMSHFLDQQLGAEVTTGLAVALGVISLGLAIFPIWTAWKAPASPPDTVVEPVIVPRDAFGEEIVHMHPERLQQLYGISTPVREAVLPVLADEPPAIPDAAPEPTTTGNDVTLGLIADLSEVFSQQQTHISRLSQQLSQQQHLIELLTSQMKAQSSAFLLQGERLLQLENVAADRVLAVATEDEGSRLTTFDQAIALAATGASVETLMAECGLSVSEARLVALVHGKAIS